MLKAGASLVLVSHVTPGIMGDETEAIILDGAVPISNGGVILLGFMQWVVLFLPMMAF